MVTPTCQELSPFVSSTNEPAYVTSRAVLRRMDVARTNLPRSQQVLAAEHGGFLLEHFSQHGVPPGEHVCDHCGVVVDIYCIEHIYRMAQVMFCSEKCYAVSLPAYYARLKFKRRALNPRVHPHDRGPHARDIDMHVMPTIHGSSRPGPLLARVVAAAYIKAQLHTASMPEWLRDLSNGSRVLMCTLQFPQHSPFDRT